jgi:hypothetical protein
MAGMKAAKMVLQEMQVLDQEVAPALARADQGLHLSECSRVELAAFWVIGAAPPPGPGVDAAIVVG